MTDKLEPCILPWINFCTNPFGRSRPCGYSKMKSENKVQNSSISEEFNNELFKSVRRDFLRGVWPENCQRCEYIEKNMPGHSKKSSEQLYFTQHSRLLDQTKSDGSVPYFPKQIDIRLGTLCNLKCIHCGTGNSSKWLEDKELLGKYENTENIKPDNSWVDHDNPMWENVYEHLHEIEKFNFLGGEPFASRQHNHLLERMANSPHAKNIILHYVTNGTLLNQRLIDHLQKFKQVTLNVSFDATGDPLAFFRFPIQVETLYRNLRLLDENATPNLDLGLQWTSSNISIFYLSETLDYFAKSFQNLKFKFCNYVDRPAQMSTQNLPERVKRLTAEKLRSYATQYPQVSFYLQHMQERDLWPSMGETFLTYMNDLSRVRQLDWRKSMPALADHLGTASPLEFQI